MATVTFVLEVMAIQRLGVGREVFGSAAVANLGVCGKSAVGF